MKTLVFGNSHSACLIEAWRANSAAHSGRMEFFVCSGSGPTDYLLSKDRISAQSAKFVRFLERLSLSTAHDLDEFDTFIIIGSEISFFHVVNVLNHYRVLDWPMRQDKSMPALTESVLRLAVSEALAGSNGGNLMKRLQACSALDKKRLLVLPQPFPSERVLVSKENGVGVRRLVRNEASKLTARLFHEEVRLLCERFGAVYLIQPEDTIIHGCLTAEKYNIAARRLINLRQMQPAQDILHANAIYGKKILQQILAITTGG